MVDYMAIDGYYMSYAIGTDLTAWRNADAALTVGESNALDWFVSASVRHTQPRTINVNPMSAGHISKRLTTGNYLGSIRSTHYLQTGVLTYAVMGASTAVAAGVERDITKDTDETPINLGFHFEKEGGSAARRKDALGVVSRNLSIDVSERQPFARQIYSSDFAKTVAGGDLAEPTKKSQATFAPYTWYNYKNSSGASAFTYNSGAINVDVIGFTINFGWSDTLFGTYDGSAFPTTGKYVPPFVATVDIDALKTDAAGTDIEAIADLDHDSYAGDLDFVTDFYQSATRYLKYTFDKMYIVPDSLEERFQSEGAWFDGVSFQLAFSDENSSLAVATKDAHDDTYYTNP